jgi:serine/threonine protein kinase
MAGLQPDRISRAATPVPPAAASAASEDVRLRQRLELALENDFTLVRQLGRGGMGAVYLARELALDRLVAIKVLPPATREDAERRARFQREAQLAARLTHPNIVPLHSYGERDGLSFYAMGYVRGESLADRLRRDGRLPAEEVRRLLAEIADALEYAHAKGVIHRDIKPDNVLIDDESGRPLLADFGIARAAEAGADADGIVGTPHYMSPEQAAGVPTIDGRTDVYSLGVVGYVLLTGVTPFASTTVREFVLEQRTSEAPSLAARAANVPPDLAASIMRSLARDPDRRWPTAQAFKESLGASLADDPDRLSGELREVAGGLFYSALWMWLSSIAGLVWSPNQLLLTLWFVAIVPASYALMVVKHHRSGASWRDLGRAVLWPPGWWPFWWPLAWRRPWDIWRRLPPAVQRFRAGYGLLLLLALAALPLGIRTDTTLFLITEGVLFYLVTTLMITTAVWASRRRMPNNADLRSLMFRSTANPRFWKRPQMAKLLLPLNPARAAAAPSSPAGCVRHLTDAVQRLTGEPRELTMRGLELARLACQTVERFDLAEPSADSRAAPDPARLQDTLRQLCVEVETVSRANGATTSRLATLVRSLEHDLADAVAPVDRHAPIVGGDATMATRDLS